MMTTLRHPALLLAALMMVALAAACGGADRAPESVTASEGGPDPSGGPGATASPGDAPLVVSPEFPHATGPAVVVAAGYEPPSDRVPSTGAYLPSNGKPTLVFVDAIW